MKGVARLVYEFEPKNYQLELSPDRNKMIFDGRVIITGRKTGRPSHRITLHQNGLKIKSANLIFFDKKKGELNMPISRINHLKTQDEVRIHSSEILYPGNYRIEIFFTGIINQQMHGMYASSYELDGRTMKLIATQFESHYAREVFPCIDEPEAKSTFDLSIISPPGETVLSNTPIKHQKSGQQQITVFQTTPVMSTYLLAFAFGDLKYKEVSSSNGISVRCYSTPGNYEFLDFSLEVAVKAVDFFEHYFGISYPLSKLDLLALPDFSAGAMENWGLITFRESCMLMNPSSSSIESKQLVAIIICHEIAHQWFGNLVTMRWWDDLWLNESFATVMEYRAVDEIFPEWNIWEHFVNNEVGSALRRDCLPNVQPVRVGVHHPEEISTLFDPSIVYAKGSVLLRMLMGMIGEDKFRAGLSEYFKVHEYKNTAGSDLWNALSKASGQDLESFMSKWLNAPGFPVVTVDYVPGADSAELAQARLSINGDEDDQTLWPISLSPSLKIKPTLLEKKHEIIKVQTANYPLVLNDGCRSYFVTQYLNPEHFTSILNSVQDGTLSVVNRMTLLLSYTLLERACAVSTVSNLEMLSSFRDEQEEAVWSLMAVAISTTRRLVFATAGEEPVKEFVSSLATPVIDRLGWETGPNETSQIHRLRGLALSLGASAAKPDVIGEGLERFSKFKLPADLAPDIRGAVYFVGARYGTKKEFLKLLALHDEITNSEEKEEICSALTSTRDRQNISILIEMLNSSSIRLQDLSTWFAHLIANPYAKGQAWEWLTDNWDRLESLYGEDPTIDRYPRYAATAFSHSEDLIKYQAFFNTKKKIIAYRRSIQLGEEEITGRVKWRLKNETDAVKWLIKWQGANS